MRWPLIAAAWYVIWSVAAFVAFTLDKRAARRGRRRVPERTLHTIELLGGWPGAIAAMFVVRHKLRKARYVLALAAIVAIHAIGWAILIGR